jgi:hypothetical protein
MEDSVTTENAENTEDGTPEAEATKEEVLDCLKSMLRDIMDTSGVRKAEKPYQSTEAQLLRSYLAPSERTFRRADAGGREGRD